MGRVGGVEDAGTWGSWFFASYIVHDPCTAAAGREVVSGWYMAWLTRADHVPFGTNPSSTLSRRSQNLPVLYVHPQSFYQKVNRDIHRSLAYEGTVYAASH